MSTKCVVQLTTAHWQKMTSRYYQIARHGQELLRRDIGKIYQSTTGDQQIRLSGRCVAGLVAVGPRSRRGYSSLEHDFGVEKR
jgi:hypothetical protein